MTQQQYHARVWQEDDWFVAQCLEIDVASQGHSEAEALANLREALELYLAEPLPTVLPRVHEITVSVKAA